MLVMLMLVMVMLVMVMLVITNVTIFSKIHIWRTQLYVHMVIKSVHLDHGLVLNQVDYIFKLKDVFVMTELLIIDFIVHSIEETTVK